MTNDYTLSFILILVLIRTPALAVDECSIIKSFIGEFQEEQFGRSVASAGDVDNDGVNDFIVGAPHYNGIGTRSGRALVFSGSDWELLYSFQGPFEFGYFGLSVSSAGDVNNDSYTDLIIGAPNAFDYGSGPGRAYIFSGQDGGLIYSYVGEAINNFFGMSVASAGDADNDGYGDFVIGANGYDEFYGRVYLYSGRTGDTLFTLTGDSAFDELGRSVAGVGDLNNDEHDDFIVGASGWAYHPGKVFVISGNGGDTLFSFSSESEWMGYGRSVAPAGDINNDGVGDLIIGNDEYGSFFSTGRAYAYSGLDGSLLYVFDPDYSGQFGLAVSSAGDVNNDGYDDVAIGAYFEDNQNGNHAGNVYVYSGFDGSLVRKFLGDLSVSYFGISVAAAGDVNRDGFDDIITGAMLYSEPLYNIGKAYILSLVSCYFNKGDVNHDGIDSSILDLNFLVNRIFRSGPAPACSEEGDVNSDGISANILDLNFLVNDIFRGGPSAGACY